VGTGQGRSKGSRGCGRYPIVMVGEGGNVWDLEGWGKGIAGRGGKRHVAK